MKHIIQYIQEKLKISETSFMLEKLKINSSTKINQYKYHPKDKKELEDIIKKLIEERGNEADLNDIDVSHIDNMEKLFINSEFNGDISKWDVSNVKDMWRMFEGSKFTGENGDISQWNVNNNVYMHCIFYNCPLAKNPPKWYKK